MASYLPVLAVVSIVALFTKSNKAHAGLVSILAFYSAPDLPPASSHPFRLEPSIHLDMLSSREVVTAGFLGSKACKAGRSLAEAFAKADEGGQSTVVLQDGGPTPRQRG